MTGKHMYNLYHILFIIVFILCLTLQIIITNKRKPGKKEISIYTNILAIIILIGVILIRVSITIFNIKHHINNYKWYFFIPDTWCSLVGIVYSLNMLFFKRNENILHYTAFVGFLGGIMTLFFPNFLNTEFFFHIKSFPSFIYHAAMVLLTVYLIQTGEFIPTMKKSVYFIIGMTLAMIFGFFEKNIMHMEKPMQIDDPFFHNSRFLSILTGWPVVILGEFIFVIITCMIFDRKYKCYEKEAN